MKPNDFSTIDGEAWRQALTEARKRRKSQGKRVREAIKQAAECAEALNDIADLFNLRTGASPSEVAESVTVFVAAVRAITQRPIDAFEVDGATADCNVAGRLGL